MSIFYPHYAYRRIYKIPTEFFLEKGIRALFIDVDNTLTTDNNPVPHGKVLAWLEAQRKAGIAVMAFSNNYESRVAPFAKQLDLGYVSMAAKPLPFRLWSGVHDAGLKVRQTAVIGDQVFTDILCGRLAGCTTILVEPMEIENYGLYVPKRKWEKVVLRHYRPKTWQPQKGE